ncbi:MAG TPA: alpha/beta hydrolase [Actinotalea sp.]|nr:alpha/beta hydrolase [Actinotalea sp.]
MRFRIALTSAAVVLAFGVGGAVVGPDWDPVPMTETIEVPTADTTIGGSQGTDPVGTYEVSTSVVTVELAGTEVEAQISEPVGAEGPRPGVVFVHGAGTGRFEDAFVDQAHALASAGVVAMVPNKRLDTYSTRDRSYPAMANDYLRSVDLLRERSGVDPERVGIYGESEGAWVIPIMAADNPAVAFTVLVAAPVVPPRQQAAFAVDSYLRATGVPVELMRSIPRLVGMEFPGGGFAYVDFDVRAFQQRMRQPVLVVYGTGDAAMPTVQGALQVIADVTVADNPDWTVRYYEGANHGIRVDHELVPAFARDLAAWIQGLPQTGDAAPRVAGDTPTQQYVARAVERPRWFAEGDLIVATLGVVALALLIGPVLWLVDRLRGRRGPVLAAGVALPLTVMTLAATASFALMVGYLVVIADLALNYRTNDLVVQGGWLVIRLLAVTSVVAGVVLVYRVIDGRRLGGLRAARSATGRWCLGGAVTAAVLLLGQLSYWGVFLTFS